MNSKSYAFLDRYAKLQPHSNFLLYHTNYALTPIDLRRKRILAFYLKKLKKFVYSVESDAKILDLCIGILNYLMLSYCPETQKVETQLLQCLEDLTFIIYLYTQEDEIFNQFFNHLTQLSKRKQKYSNVFQQIQRIVGLMIMTKKTKHIPDFLVGTYSSNSDHMNNIKFTLLLNIFNTLPSKLITLKFTNKVCYKLLNYKSYSDQFQLKQYKEKVLKEKNVTTDMILDLAKQTQNQETIEEVLLILKNYKNDFHGADSFLIKKKYFQLAYENGDLLEKEEIMELLNADLFDLEYVQQIISYVEFFIDDHQSFVKEIILKVLEFSYGNSYLWNKLVRVFTKVEKDSSMNYEQEEEEQDSAQNQSFQQTGSQDKINSDMEVEGEINSSSNQSGKGDYKQRKKEKSSKEQKVQFTDQDVEFISKVQYSGKYKKQDLNILKKIASQNLSIKLSEDNLFQQFLHNKYKILQILLAIKEENSLLLEYKKEFDELQIKNTSMELV